jgi:predicted RNase H-like HicB family nuclease
MKPYFTAIIEKEDDMFVALCPELDIASQGTTVEEAKTNLKEAIELFFEFASSSEITSRPMPNIIRQSGLPKELFLTK